MINIFKKNRPKKCASIFITHSFIEIKTYSHHGLAFPDPTAPSAVLTLDISDQLLGQSLLTGLQASRLLTLEELDQIHLASQERYQTWIKERMQQFGYKSKRALFRYMDNCFVSGSEGKIKISPQYHERLDGWGRTKNDGIEDVILPETASPDALGAALRLAFRRCVTKKGKVIVDNPNIPFEERQQQWVPEARVFATPNEMEIATYSRYGLSVKDTTQTPFIFSADVSNTELGETVKKVLAQSRFLSYEEAEQLLVQAPQAQKNWIAECQTQWHYPNKRKLLVKMRCCVITQSNHQLFFKPSHHDKLENWTTAHLPEAQTVVTSADATPAELGEALRLALQRCTSKVR